MKYSPRPFERLLTRFIARQIKIIEGLINQFAFDAATQATRALQSKTEGDFFFRDYPALSRQIDLLLRGLSNRLTKTIQAGVEWSWDLANAKNDNMLNKVLDSIGRERVPANALARWSQKNLPALAAFEKRRIGGMNLSDKVWNYTRGIKGDLELALDLGIAEGASADKLARAIQGYLNEPNRLYRRVRDEKGVLRLSQSASNYHPGQGVYRSSFKNAKRLAATETNIAYRTADNERMNQMDWILGYEVHISDTNHTCLDSHGVPQPFYDICDELQGRYPKWFRFVGWHPNCYDEESEVYTSNGWKHFADVGDDDLILTINPYSFDLEWSPFRYGIKSQYKGKMIHFFNRSYDALVTPDHEVLGLDKSVREPIFMRTTAKKCGKSQPIYRSSEWMGNYITEVKIGDLIVPYALFAEFMGYWLSDGSLGHKWAIVIAQQDEHRKAIYDCIEAMGMKPRYNDKSGKVEFNNRDWYIYLQQFGTCAEKFIPQEIREATPDQIQIFLDAFISCDGYIKKPRSFVGNRGGICNPTEGERIYFTSSKRMADELGELILKIGRRPSFKIASRAGTISKFKNGVYATNYDCWTISECRSKTVTQYSKEEIDYDGWVYDLVLEKNATMYIRRNGKCFWGSNCRCYITTILPERDEMIKYLAAMDENGVSPYQLDGMVVNVNPKLTDWLERNEKRVMDAKSLPYWLMDNPEVAISDKMASKIDYQNLTKRLRNEERNSIPKDTPTITDELRQKFNRFPITGSDEFDFESDLFAKYDTMVAPTSEQWIWADRDTRWALVSYTDGDYYYPRINAYARTGEIDTDCRQDIPKMVSNMEHFINGTRLREDMILRRGTGYGEIRAVFGDDVLEAILNGDNSAIGRLGVQRGFLSTSFNEFGGYQLGRTMDTKVEMRILAPKGTQGTFAKCFSRSDMNLGTNWDGKLPSDKVYQSDAENEIILNTNMAMRIIGYEVINAEQGYIRLLCEVIGKL